MTKVLTFFILFGLHLLNLAKAQDSFDFEYYSVQDKETLSEILWKKNISPLYGKKGFILKTIKLNPGLKPSNGDKIFIDNIIKIPRLNFSELEKRIEEEFVEEKDEISPETIISQNEEEKMGQISTYLIGLGPQYYRYDLSQMNEGASSTIISGPSPSIQLGLIKYYDDFFIQSELKYTRVDLNNTKQEIKLTSTQEDIINFDLGLNSAINSYLTLGPLIGFRSDIIFNLIDSKIVLDQLELFSAGARIEGKIYEQNGLILKMINKNQIIVNGVSGSHIGLELGLSPQIDFSLKDNKTLFFRTNYEISSQKIKTINRSTQSLGFYTGISF